MSSPTAALFRKRLRDRAPLRRGLASENTSAYRVFNGAAEGIAGLVVERFGPVAVFQTYEGQCALGRADIEVLAQVCAEEVGVESIYLKHFVVDRSHALAESSHLASEPLFGKTAAEEIRASENGIVFLIHPYDGFSTGLFLDQRENRKFLSHRVSGKEVLNCFAYTCGFSLYGVLANAQRVTSVDVSKKYLEWGKRNFKENGIAEPSGHRFFEADTRHFLQKAKQKNERYDLIILDPPSFSRSRFGPPFSIRKDLPALVRGAAAVLKPGGELFVSSNLSEWDEGDLRRAVQLGADNQQIKWIELPPLPADYLPEAAPMHAILAKL